MEEGVGKLSAAPCSSSGKRRGSGRGWWDHRLSHAYTSTGIDKVGKGGHLGKRGGASATGASVHNAEGVASRRERKVGSGTGPLPPGPLPELTEGVASGQEQIGSGLVEGTLFLDVDQRPCGLRSQRAWVTILTILTIFMGWTSEGA